MAVNFEKSLIYVVNRIGKQDSQHFVHIPNLLNRLCLDGWSIRLISERGGRGQTTVSGIPLTYLSSEGRWSRLPKLASALIGARRGGNRLVFVRISKSAALVSAVLGRIFGWKTLYWLCGKNEDFNIREKSWIGRGEIIFLWILFRLVDNLVTGPEEMNKYYRDYYGLPERKVITLYNDIETEGLPAADRYEEKRHETTLNILMVHRLSPIRETMNWFPGIMKMLSRRQAAGKWTRFDVVGGGPELPELQEEAVKYPDVDIHFHGTVPNSDLECFYRRADLFIMPSAREGFPRVVIEAMGRALPIVATAAGGTRDLFGPLSRPYCFALDDTEGFAKAIDELLDDRELRVQLARENRERVEKYSTISVARQYDEKLSGILAG